ncbi:MAG: sugar transferase [Bacteroidetes bacterium]|nr:sugar transferase [Bacteroidota bacterium]
MAPVFAAIAAAILLDDGRPVFFTQTRVGRDEVPFRIWKFRTLPPAPQASATADDDCEVGEECRSMHARKMPARAATRVGGVLRAWSLDELPQLWNVLRGDMSLIGPRPTIPEQVARYGEYERKRLRVRPGITGWAQIHGRNLLSWPERINLDVWYVENWSLGLDLRILLRTPAVVLSGHGVNGREGRNPDFPAHDAHDPSRTSSPPSSFR